MKRGLAILALTSLLLSCRGTPDHHAAVVAAVQACQGIRVSTESPFQNPAMNEFNDVSTECAAALDGVFEIDKPSFRLATRPVLNRVYESLQILMSYPYTMRTDGRMFGVSDSVGVLPSSVACILWPTSDCADSGVLGPTGTNPAFRMAEHLFEWVSEKISRFKYEPISRAGNAYARYTLHNLDAFDGQATITDEFAPGDGEVPDFLNRNRFTRTAILVHESGHGTYGSHVVCNTPESGADPDALRCDETLGGPFGLEVNYMLALMRANWGRTDGNGVQILTERDGTMLARAVCYIVQKRPNRRADSLTALITGRDCTEVTWDWLTRAMGLPPLPQGN